MQRRFVAGGGDEMMDRVSRTAVIGASAALLLGCALPAGADDRLTLTVCRNADGLVCRWRGEWDWRPADRWRLEVSAGLPQPVENVDPAWVGLEAVWSGENWRWTAGLGCARGADPPGSLRLDLGAVYMRAAWRASGAAAWERDTMGPDGELALTGALSYRLNRSWRLSCRQEYAEVTSGGGANRYRRYAADAAAAWRNPGCALDLRLGGTAHEDEDPLRDERTLYAEIGGVRGLSGGWSLGGEARWSRNEKQPSSEDTVRLSASLARRAPVGLRLQASSETDGTGTDWRCGLTVSGRTGAWSWRTGVAGELADGDPPAVWPFAVFTWRNKAWEASFGLTPEGEYAANSRQGYWVGVSYLF
ncbi:MAG: hypothetical protein ACM3XS_02010 [Bacteroidota bacterium]